MHKANDDFTSDDRANDAGRNAANDADANDVTDATNAAEGNGGANDATNAADGSAGIRAEKSATAPLADKPRDEHGLMIQMTRFIISGVIAAVVDFGTLIIMNWVFGVDRTVSKAVAWVFGTITAYMINRRWTFRAEASGKRLAAVAALYLTTFAVQNAIFWAAPFLLVDQWGWGRGLSDTVAFVVAQGVATVVNFIVQRTVIFKVK
ncbi:MAG: GtrA family protein [Corynebacterium sp.]|nr:GtrA family protein [Corynebacterium sp.]